MDIAKEADMGDETLIFGDVSIFLQEAASLILTDAAIDYADDRGFVISGMAGSSCC